MAESHSHVWRTRSSTHWQYPPDTVRQTMSARRNCRVPVTCFHVRQKLNRLSFPNRERESRRDRCAADTSVRSLRRTTWRSHAKKQFMKGYGFSRAKKGRKKLRAAQKAPPQILNTPQWITRSSPQRCYCVPARLKVSCLLFSGPVVTTRRAIHLHARNFASAPFPRATSADAEAPYRKAL